MLYWLMKYVFIGPVLRIVFRPTYEGVEHVPRKGGAVIASNHLAVVDSFFMPLGLRRRVTFPAKIEYFTGTGVTGAFKRWFFSGLGQVPIDRSGGTASQAALEAGMRIVRSGKLFGIYPEGTRSPDGRLYKGKTGVARIALETGCPVVPVVMTGTDEVNPIGSRRLRRRPVRVTFGPPLDFSRYAGLAGDRFIERSVTDEIMYALMELSGQEYVDVYAATVKQAAPGHAGVSTSRQRTAADADRIPSTRAG